MRFIPGYRIDEDDRLPLGSDPELDRRYGRTTVVLGDLTSGEFDLQGRPERPLDGDALTVVLRSGERVRRPGWLRAPRFAVIALLVLGAGVSIRVFKRQTGESHVRAGIVRHRIAKSKTRAVQEIGTASSPLRPRISPLRDEGRRSQSRLRPPRTQRGRATWSTRINRRPALPTPQEPENGAASAGGSPHVDDATPSQTEARPSVPSRRPLCVPGTLGC